jgi:PleD family two-component response regulator
MMDRIKPAPIDSSLLNRVLMVDDTIFNVEITKMMLKETFNIDIDWAYSGDEAILQIHKRQT